MIYSLKTSGLRTIFSVNRYWALEV